MPDFFVGEYGARDDDEEDEDGEEFDLAALGLAHLVVDEDSEEGRGGRGKRRADDAPTDVVSRPRRNIDDAFDALLEREYEDDQIGDLDEELCERGRDGPAAGSGAASRGSKISPSLAASPAGTSSRAGGATRACKRSSAVVWCAVVRHW